MPLSREQILEAEDLQTVEVDVPEWDGTVLVRGLTGQERDEYEVALLEFRRGPKGERRAEMRWENARAKRLVRCCVDATGTRLFSDDDVIRLGRKSGAALERVFKQARTLSGLSGGDLEELVEGFGPAQSEGSTSG